VQQLRADRDADGDELQRTASPRQRAIVPGESGRCGGNLSGYSNVASATTMGANAQIYYIHPDHLNTPAYADSTGTTVGDGTRENRLGTTCRTQSFGAGAFDSPEIPGQYFDRETNLAYNYFRITIRVSALC